MKIIVYLVSLVFAVTSTESKKLASYISPCKRADPNFIECATKQANEAVPHLIEGDKELNILKLDPLKISKLELNSGSNLKLTLTDVAIVGLKTFHARKIELHDNYVALDHTFSKIVLTGQYTISGQIMVLPITGSGPIEIEFFDLEFLNKYLFELYKKPDGKEYPRRTGLEINVTARDAKYHLKNLFNGNKQLGDSMNKLLNENPKEVLRDIGYPLAKEVVSLMVGAVVDAVITDVPFDEIYLP